MSMITELVKRLKEEADLAKYTHDYTAKLLKEAADTIERLEKGYNTIYYTPKTESGSSTGGWIPVSEKLPEEVGTYMTTVDYEKHGIAVGQRYYHGKGLGWEDDCVIAWMPLPEAYKESEGEE